MSVRVRLTRVGSNKNPIWRVVVADQRSPRDGRFIETIGHYNPQTDPSTIVIDEERFQHWVSRGAQPTNTVKQLVKAHAKGMAGGTSTGCAGVSQARAAVAEAPAEDEEAQADVIRGARGGSRGARPLPRRGRRGPRDETPPMSPRRRPSRRGRRRRRVGGGAPRVPRPVARRPARTRSPWSRFEEDDGTLVLELHVADDDAGKVIGRGGRTVAAIRTVMKAAAVSDGQRVLVDVVD